MGHFAAELKRVMKKKGISVAEMESAAKGAVKLSTLKALLGNTKPFRLSIIDKIASLTGENNRKFRALAFLDHAEHLLDHFEVKWPEVMPKLQEKARNEWKLPLINASELSDQLTPVGFLKKEPDRYLSVSFDFGNSAIALNADLDIFFHRVRKGEIAILSRDRIEPYDEDFGVICAFDKFYAGKITTPLGGISVHTLDPYGVSHFHKRDVKSILWVVGVIRIPVLP